MSSKFSHLDGRRVLVTGSSKGIGRALAEGRAAHGAHGLQVNAIAPGFFKTPLNQALVDDPAFTERLEIRTPASLSGEVKELQGAAVFLISDAASFMNGQTIFIDGGITASI